METQKFNIAVIFAIALTAMVVTALAASLLMDYRRVPNYGSVKAVRIGVYSNSACTNNLTSINWGLLEAGAEASREIWIKNIGNTKITLNMTTENWDPNSASDYMELSWNMEGQVLDVNQSIKAVLTLFVSADIKETGITEFSFTIVIKGIEYTS
ncbi:MAG: hypothetical protein QHH12_02715 [Candidatus Bathyarchaeota archaeon]|jgi:hypothetical protein|nr:hypothetical protein [Candidatus Bathyarchaeota archaeon]